MVAHERLVRPSALDQCAKHADEKREVAAGVHIEPVIGEPGAEQRALRDRRHPVPFEAGLPECVDHRDLGAVGLGVMEVLRGHRLVVGGVRSEQHDQIGMQPIGVAAGRRAIAERPLHRGGRRRVTQARRVVDVVGAEEARRLLRRVVHLVGDAARGEIEGDTRRIGRLQLLSDPIERFLPGRDEKPGFATAAQQRLRQASQRAELL